MEPQKGIGLVNIHGQPVQVTCHLPWLEESIGQLLAGFDRAGVAQAGLNQPGGDLLEDAAALPAVPSAPIRLEIHPFDEDVVLRQASSRATRLAGHQEAMDIYQEQDRFWLVDDRWGMAQINLMRGTAESWVINHPRTDPLSTAEAAMLWPLAQLLNIRRMHLLPAISVARDGFGLLILSGMDLETELRTLVQAGYRIIGQRWTALRAEPEGITLCQMPGPMQQSYMAGPWQPMRLLQRSWVDLLGFYLGASRESAPCHAVVITHPGRRSMAFVEPLDRVEAMGYLRAAWPITELSLPGRVSHLIPQLARQSAIYRLQLTNQPREMLDMLADLRDRNSQSSVRSSIHPRAIGGALGLEAGPRISGPSRSTQRATQAAMLQQAAELLRKSQKQSIKPTNPPPAVVHGSSGSQPADAAADKKQTTQAPAMRPQRQSNQQQSIQQKGIDPQATRLPAKPSMSQPGEAKAPKAKDANRREIVKSLQQAMEQAREELFSEDAPQAESKQRRAG